MAGNRKHGFLYGNKAGRNGVGMLKKWFCKGCEREHGASVIRNKRLDGFDYCNKQYFKFKENIIVLKEG